MLRVGIGYDAHPLAQGRRLVLGGVDIPWEEGLCGNSDADVLTHAVIDALLGAAGLGDIGVFFPADDPKYKDISSLKLLAEAGRMVREKGFRVSSIDSTVVAAFPTLAPFIAQMKLNLAAALEIPAEQVMAKAASGNGLGFPGRGEGMAAYAVSLLEK
ncbi:MAG: 2-C-methyl-D-erythritol 2,4-cyclodiphosphate synthase [Chloroflexota bacterium]